MKPERRKIIVEDFYGRYTHTFSVIKNPKKNKNYKSPEYDYLGFPRSMTLHLRNDGSFEIAISCDHPYHKDRNHKLESRIKIED